MGYGTVAQNWFGTKSKGNRNNERMCVGGNQTKWWNPKAVKQYEALGYYQTTDTSEMAALADTTTAVTEESTEAKYSLS